MRGVHLLLTESLVLFLVCGFAFHFCKLHKTASRVWPHLALASSYLCYLALTKVLFGYVIGAGLVASALLLLRQRDLSRKKTVYVYLLALVGCTPYLLLTHGTTGKPFYWGTSGGMSLYWMSTPYKEEFGDWFSRAAVQERSELFRHREFFDRISAYSEVEQDRAFKEKAVANIQTHKAKYVSNWVANVGRLLFSYPFSYTPQKLSTYFYLFPNMVIVVLLLLSALPGVRHRDSIPFEIKALLFLDLVAFGGGSLLSAYARQFIPLVPILILWLVWVNAHLVRKCLGEPRLGA